MTICSALTRVVLNCHVWGPKSVVLMVNARSQVVARTIVTVWVPEYVIQMPVSVWTRVRPGVVSAIRCVTKMAIVASELDVRTMAHVLVIVCVCWANAGRSIASRRRIVQLVSTA